MHHFGKIEAFLWFSSHKPKKPPNNDLNSFSYPFWGFFHFCCLYTHQPLAEIHFLPLPLSVMEQHSYNDVVWVGNWFIIGCFLWCYVLDKGKKASRDLFDSMLCIKFPVLSLQDKKKKRKTRKLVKKVRKHVKKMIISKPFSKYEQRKEESIFQSKMLGIVLSMWTNWLFS